VKIGLSDYEIETWREMGRKMFVPFYEDPDLGGGIFS
jgi:hypothetical protein